MAEPNEDGGLVLPEGAEPHVVLVGIGEDDVLEGRRGLHAASLGAYDPFA